jgi:hypothetical protein
VISAACPDDDMGWSHGRHLSTTGELQGTAEGDRGDFEPPPFGTTIRIPRPHHPCCLIWRAGELRFLRTVSDRW